MLLGNLIVHHGNGSGDNLADILKVDNGQDLIGTGDIDGDGLPEVFLASTDTVYAHTLAAYGNLPKIELTSPQDRSSTSSSFITITGRVIGSVASLAIGNSYWFRETPVEPDGSFTKEIYLGDEQNTIEIIATTSEGKISKRTLNVTYIAPPALTVAITSPVEGAVLQSTPVTVTGTVSDSLATVTVNGVEAAVSQGNFEAVVNLTEGTNTISTLATDQYSQTAYASVNVQLAYPVPTVSFGATPQAIHPGESATLAWTSTDALSCSIDQGIGTVPVNGSVTVSPAETTTYTLTALGQGTTSATASVTLTVINTAPVTVDDSAATDEDIAVVINVLANDWDADGDALTITGASEAAHGIVAINADRTLTYTPAQNFNGADGFTYTVKDGHGGTAAASVAITILPVNDPPTAADDAAETDQGTFVSIAVLANDSDPDGDSLQVATFSQPSNGTVSDEGNGSLRYSPAAGFSGQDTFTYTAQDPSGAVSTAQVRITVTSPISLVITSPTGGQTIDGNKVLVEGTVVNNRGLETGVTVNGIPAIIYSGQFIANEVALVDGENTITAVAKDVNGNTVIASIILTAENEADCVEIRSISYWGVSPFETTLLVTGSIGEPTVTHTGPGEVEYLPQTNPGEYPIRITTEGIYHFTAQALDAQGEPCSNTLAVVVLNKLELDALLRSKWNGMKSKLSTGSIEDALNYFREGSRENYRQIFNSLATKLPELVSGMQEIEMVATQGKRVEYRINRVHIVDNEPVTINYTIYFLLDEDGIWRLDRF
ncbi:MAG: Ig-like domain-containing protein [Syntrophobacteraceae bacterium]